MLSWRVKLLVLRLSHVKNGSQHVGCKRLAVCNRNVVIYIIGQRLKIHHITLIILRMARKDLFTKTFFTEKRINHKQVITDFETMSEGA